MLAAEVSPSAVNAKERRRWKHIVAFTTLPLIDAAAARTGHPPAVRHKARLRPASMDRWAWVWAFCACNAAACAYSPPRPSRQWRHCPAAPS